MKYKQITKTTYLWRIYKVAMQTSSLNYVTKSDLQYKKQQNEKGKFSNVEVFQKIYTVKIKRAKR